MRTKKLQTTPRFLSFLTFIVITTCSPLVFCAFELNPDKDYWRILESVKLRSAVIEETEYLYLKPKFNKKLRRLNGKKIKLEGYLSFDGEAYILTKFLSSRGQCRSLGPGPKQTISLDLSTAIEFRTNKWVLVAGNLKLNENQPIEPIYRLQNTACLTCQGLPLKKT